MKGSLYHDERIPVGLKRTYWTASDAQDVKRRIVKEVKSMRSKRGKPYSRQDAKKIAAERWGELCERHPKPGEL